MDEAGKSRSIVVQAERSCMESLLPGALQGDYVSGQRVGRYAFQDAEGQVLRLAFTKQFVALWPESPTRFYSGTSRKRLGEAVSFFVFAVYGNRLSRRFF